MFLQMLYHIKIIHQGIEIISVSLNFWLKLNQFAFVRDITVYMRISKGIKEGMSFTRFMLKLHLFLF